MHVTRRTILAATTITATAAIIGTPQLRAPLYR